MRLLTGRAPSYTPAETATRLFGLRPRTGSHLTRLNWTAHLIGGTLWGPCGAALRRGSGVGGPRSSLLLFALVWPLECVGLMRLGVAEAPWRWTQRDLVVDVGHKVLLALVSGAAYERLLPKDTRL